MTQPASVRVTVYVAVDPDTAFDVFTNEIDAWYQRGPHAFYDTRRAVGIRFEPGPEGRLVEVYDDASGEGRTLGTVRVWEPGKQLVFVDDRGTEVTVTFEPAGDETKVTLVHSGLERLRPDLAEKHSRFGWRLLLPWYLEHLDETRPPEGSKP